MCVCVSCVTVERGSSKCNKSMCVRVCFCFVFFKCVCGILWKDSPVKHFSMGSRPPTLGVVHSIGENFFLNFCHLMGCLWEHSTISKWKRQDLSSSLIVTGAYN